MPSHLISQHTKTEFCGAFEFILSSYDRNSNYKIKFYGSLKQIERVTFTLENSKPMTINDILQPFQFVGLHSESVIRSEVRISIFNWVLVLFVNYKLNMTGYVANFCL